LDGHKPKFCYAVAKTSGEIFGFASMRRINQKHRHHLLPNPEDQEVILDLAHPKQDPLIDVQQGRLQQPPNCKF
jgi:hypothetical protein